MKILKTAKWKDKIKGGLADKNDPKDFDKEQLEKGEKVEKEHTKDPKKAKEIAMDHLEESKDKKNKDGGKYYDKLDEMEKEIEEDLDEKKEAGIFFDLRKFAKKSKKKVNEYAVCTESIGGKEGTNKRSEWSEDAKDRYDRCLKDINPQKHKPRKKSETEETIKKAKKDNGWPKKLKEGRFTAYCKRNGFKGPCKACADKALKSDDASVRGMASFYLNTVKP